MNVYCCNIPLKSGGVFPCFYSPSVSRLCAADQTQIRLKGKMSNSCLSPTLREFIQRRNMQYVWSARLCTPDMLVFYISLCGGVCSYNQPTNRLISETAGTFCLRVCGTKSRYFRRDVGRVSSPVCGDKTRYFNRLGSTFYWGHIRMSSTTSKVERDICSTFSTTVKARDFFVGRAILKSSASIQPGTSVSLGDLINP